VKKKSKKANQQNRKSTHAGFWNIVKFLPLLLFICVMPLVVKMKVVQMDGVEAVWLPDPFVYVDVFNYYKFRLIQVVGVLSVCFMAMEWVLNNIKPIKVKRDWAILGFAGVVIVSSILSPHKAIAMNGYAERWHGMTTWLSYIAVFLYGRSIIRTPKDLKVILRMLLFSGFTLMGIGTLQFFGLDPFRLDFVKKLIATKEILEQGGLDQIKFTFDKTRVYSTLYNPNNVGIISVGFIPLAIYGLKSESNKILKGLWGFLAIFSLICLYGSESRAGMVALVVAFVIYFVINMAQLKSHYNQILLGLVGILIITFVVNFTTDGIVVERAKSILPEPDQIVGIKNIEVHSKNLLVEYNDEVIQFQHDPNAVGNIYSVLNENQKNIDVLQGRDGFFNFADLKYQGLLYGYGVYKDNQYYLAIKHNGQQYNFAILDEGLKFINQYGKLVELKTVEKLGFKNQQVMGSNRGYIWSRSIPLLKEYSLVGSGPDSFVLRFPQTDYIAKGIYYQDYKQVVDKPHNQYIGWFVETGLLGLGFILLWSFRIVLKAKGSVLVNSSLAILLTLLFYDISVSTGWLLIVGLCMVEQLMHIRNDTKTV